jgi:hypothetical protein
MSATRITILQRGGDKNHAALESAARFFLRELMSARLANTLTIRIEVRATKLDDGTLACAWLPTNGSAASKAFTVVLHRERCLRDQLEDLAHELVHVGQAASGRLQYRRWKSDGKVHARWEGTELGVVDALPYLTRPWEVEARRLAADLVSRRLTVAAERAA